MANALKPTPKEALETLFKATTYMKATLDEHNIFALCYQVVDGVISAKKTKKRPEKSNGIPK